MLFTSGTPHFLCVVGSGRPLLEDESSFALAVKHGGEAKSTRQRIGAKSGRRDIRSSMRRGALVVASLRLMLNFPARDMNNFCGSTAFWPDRESLLVDRAAENREV